MRGDRHIAFAPLYFAGALLRLIWMWMWGRADVLHVNLSSHGSTVRKVVLCRLARLLSVPYVVHLHGSRYRQFYHQLGPFGVKEVQAMFLGAARVVVLGDVWRSFIAGLMPQVERRIDILPNATRAPNRVVERDGDPVTILFLGQVGKRKGVPQLVDALERIADTPGWTGIIAGDGEIERTRSELEQRGLSARVTLTGWVDTVTVDQLLGQADILVLPSFDENLPMSVIEGMGHALAVVATPVGAVPDIIKDGETGLLVPAGDVESLARALARLVKDPVLRRHLGTQARTFHRAHLNIDTYLPRLLSIWRLAAAAKPQGRPLPAVL